MFDHITVLKQELVDALDLSVGDIAVDCTAGGGGHTAGLLNAVGKSGKVFAFDRDHMALDHLKKRFSEEISSGNLILCEAPFSKIRDVANEHGIAGEIDGICADIGVSSPQIDKAERGFSFNKDGPLDMRMDTSQGVDVATIVNTYEESELANIIWQFGEEPKSRFVARAIVTRREEKPFSTTLDFAEVVAGSIHYKTKSKKHPATKTFQALRIYVNSELEELETLCRDGFDILKSGRRISVITFHSLEDKFVKRYFNTLAKGEKLPSHLKNAPLTGVQIDKLKNIKAKIIKPFPMIPSDQELEDNPRSRSSKLRTISKLETNSEN